MTQQETIELVSKLLNVKGLTGRELCYAIKKNIKNLSTDMEFFKEEEEDLLKTIKEFTIEREKIRKKYIDPTNKVEIKNAVGIPDEKFLEFGKEIDALAGIEPHKSAIKEYEDKSAELLRLRKAKTSDFVITKVKMSDVPENISNDNMNLIFDIIE